jgi:AAA family ATP:ADP antiporter
VRTPEKQWWRRVADVRRGEGMRAGLMFATILLQIAAYTTTKAVRDAVFLTKFGLRELSWVMIGVAIVAGFLVSLFTRATAGLQRNRLIFVTNSVIAVTLVAMAPGLRLGWSWLAWALYFWSAVFGLVIVAEFWLLANDLFNAREAKRLFPLIGAGAILGGVIGGGISGWLARPLGSPALLYVIAAMLVLASFTAHLAWRLRPAEARAEANQPSAPPRFAEGLALLKKSSYLRLIAAMMVMMTICMTLVQWQYKGIAKNYFGDRRDDMTAFFGTLSAVLNLASFVIQLVGTPRILRRFGIGVGLRVLPTAFVVGALMILSTLVIPFSPLVAAAAAALLSDGFRFSVDKALTELCYVPIPRAVKDQAKPFIDTVVDRFAGALAGFLWLSLDWAFHVDRPGRIAYASVATLLVVGGWLFVIARARRGYVDAYRRMLSPPPPTPELDRAAHEAIAALRAAAHADPVARTRVLYAISRRRRVEPSLRLPRAAVEPLLAREADTLELLAGALRAEGAVPSTTYIPSERRRPRTLLVRTLEEKIDATVVRIGRALELAYPPRDMRAAFRALRGKSRAARAGALELLDNLLEGELRNRLLRALDQVALEGRDVPRIEREESLRRLRECDDRWLRACAGGIDEEPEEEQPRLATGEPAEVRC